MQVVEFSVGTLLLVGAVGATLAVGSFILYSMAREEGREITPGLKVALPVPDLPDLPEFFPRVSQPRTEEQRRASHERLYGTREPPPRGTGLRVRERAGV